MVFYIRSPVEGEYDPLAVSPLIKLDIGKKRACRSLRNAAIGSKFKASYQPVTSEVRQMTQGRSWFLAHTFAKSDNRDKIQAPS